MKQKLIITGALALLLAAILFMARDMLFNKTADLVNPYAYDLKSVKAGDTAMIMYSEVQHFVPALAAIHGIAVDKAGHVYICGENGVEIFNHAGKPMKAFAIRGTANCIQVDHGGLIYLGIQDHVEIFDQNGRQLKKWKTAGIDAIITSIAVSGKSVFIADAGNKVVYHYDLSGNLLNKIGEKDPVRQIPGFVIPSPYFDLGTGPDGELWVVNPGRHTFEQYNPEGDLISSWGKATMAMDGFCGCCNPSHFARLPDGSFVTSEKGIERIKVYSPKGDFICVVAGPASFVEGTSGLDLAVDPQERILVLDPENKKIRIFELKKP